jgi:hypothetical protein
MVLGIISTLAMVAVLILSWVALTQRREIKRLDRERGQLSKIVSMDVQHFTLSDSQEEFLKRLDYIRNCMMRYRHDKETR